MLACSHLQDVADALKSSAGAVNMMWQTPRPASILYFACRILNVVGTSAPSAFDELKRDHDLLLVFSSVSWNLVHHPNIYY